MDTVTKTQYSEKAPTLTNKIACYIATAFIKKKEPSPHQILCVLITVLMLKLKNSIISSPVSCELATIDMITLQFDQITSRV